MTNSPSANRRQALDYSFLGWALVYCAAAVVTISGLRAASSVVVPLLLAVFLAVNLSPLLKWFHRYAPFPVALAGVLLILLGVFMAVPTVIGGSVQQLQSTLPQLKEQYLGLEEQLTRPVRGMGGRRHGR